MIYEIFTDMAEGDIVEHNNIIIIWAVIYLSYTCDKERRTVMSESRFNDTNLFGAFKRENLYI